MNYCLNYALKVDITEDITKTFISFKIDYKEMRKENRTRIFFLITVLLLIMNFSLAETEGDNSLYQRESLELQLDINGGFELIPTKSNAKLKEVSANLLLFPLKDYRQDIIKWQSIGTLKEDSIEFIWDDQKLGEKEYGFSSVVDTKNKRNVVKEKISFPLSDASIKGYEDFLLPTETIDSDDPAIVAKAAELAEGEDDLFKVVFKLAEWVEENTKYDLNTLTATASQKASWVLENRQGVCDEMASLFVAMARSLGIPARFVSGISYTTSELFDEKWQPHGWAEAYFPGIGWVSFDIAFGEYGYIDVTHIKLRDSFDPTEPAIKYEWLAENVNLKRKELNLTVDVKKIGNLIPEEILLEEEILADEISLGSYNLVKGILKNTADYYTATRLQLSVPKEIEVIGGNKRTILLKPKEVRETYWIIKVSENLDESYIYQFPVVIYSEKNVSVMSSFKSQKGKNIYTKEDIEKLTIEDEEKSYSRKISFECNYAREINIDEEGKIECSIKNSGNTNLKEIKFCLGEECNTIDLSINQKKSIEISVKEKEPGWKKISLSAENNLIEKKTSLQYLALDNPNIIIEPTYPVFVNYGEDFQIEIILDKESFSNPSEVVVTLNRANFMNKWEIEELTQKENLVLNLDGNKVSYNNKFIVKTTWKDKYGKEYSDTKNIIIKGKAESILDRVKMLGNWVLTIFF
ncbi:MAG: transglutaminase-like domain-containing protein [Nanoarchaeota archaeon]